MSASRRDFMILTAAGFVAGGLEVSSAKAEVGLADGSTIVLVRHADKKAGPGDVALSPDGEIRARALRETLKDAGLSAIVTTSALRARKTAEPLAEALDLQMIEIERDSNERSKVEQAVRGQLPAAVLVVGHSETVPDFVKTFGGPQVEVSTFDNLFIVIRANGMTHFIHGRYGAASP